MLAQTFRLRKHADYQKVYQASRKQFGGQMSYFFTLRAPREAEAVRDSTGATIRNHSDEVASPGPRIGLTVGRVMGKAVDRNRIKRRMREAVRLHLSELALPVDVVLHPRRSVLDVDFAILERDIAHIFRAIARNPHAGNQTGNQEQPRRPKSPVSPTPSKQEQL